MKKVKIALLDDHKIVRDGLKSILQMYPQFEIVCEEGHPKTFLDRLPSLSFDLLILDLSLPDKTGMEVLKEVKAARPGIHIIVLTMHNNPEYMIKALKEGAGAFLTKDTMTEVLVEAIETVMLEGVYYPTEIHLKATQELPQEKDLLSLKEKEVLKLMIKGLSSKKIAAEFDLSTRTIETHRLNIMKKLGASNSAETIALALKLKLV